MRAKKPARPAAKPKHEPASAREAKGGAGWINEPESEDEIPQASLKEAIGTANIDYWEDDGPPQEQQEFMLFKLERAGWMVMKFYGMPQEPGAGWVLAQVVKRLPNRKGRNIQLQFPGERGPRNMYLDCQVGLIRLLRLRLILTIFFSVLVSVFA